MEQQQYRKDASFSVEPSEGGMQRISIWLAIDFCIETPSENGAWKPALRAFSERKERIRSRIIKSLQGEYRACFSENSYAAAYHALIKESDSHLSSIAERLRHIQNDKDLTKKAKEAMARPCYDEIELLSRLSARLMGMKAQASLGLNINPRNATAYFKSKDGLTKFYYRWASDYTSIGIEFMPNPTKEEMEAYHSLPVAHEHHYKQVLEEILRLIKTMEIQ